MTTELFAAKIRGYVQEARKLRNRQEYYTAGILYQRAARIAHKAKKPHMRYVTQALACFELEVQQSMGAENFSQAADALEHIAKIHGDNGDTQLAAELRLQASYLRLRGIESIIS